MENTYTTDGLKLSNVQNKITQYADLIDVSVYTFSVLLLKFER